MLIDDEQPPRIAPAGFGVCVFLVDLVTAGMQIVDVGRDLHVLGIDPWTLADAVAGVDR